MVFKVLPVLWICEPAGNGAKKFCLWIQSVYFLLPRTESVQAHSEVNVPSIWNMETNDVAKRYQSCNVNDLKTLKRLNILLPHLFLATNLGLFFLAATDASNCMRWTWLPFTLKKMFCPMTCRMMLLCSTIFPIRKRKMRFFVFFLCVTSHLTCNILLFFPSFVLREDMIRVSRWVINCRTSRWFPGEAWNPKKPDNHY